jgi:hypothetical protein
MLVVKRIKELDHLRGLVISALTLFLSNSRLWIERIIACPCELPIGALADYLFEERSINYLRKKLIKSNQLFVLQSSKLT